MSIISEVGEAIENVISSASLSLTPDSVAFAHLPQERLSEIGTDLNVHIVPSGLLEERGNRSQFRTEVSYTVSIEKGLGGNTNALINPMLDYEEEVRAELKGRLTTTSDLDCIFQSAEVVEVTDYASMHTDGIFVSLTKYTYRVLS